MAKMILHFAIVVAAFLIMARVIPGFYVPNLTTAIIAAHVFGIVNATLGPVLRFLSFPLIILTLGIFWFIVNGFLLILVAFLVPGFSINGWWPAIVAAAVLALINMIWDRMTREAKD